MKKRSSSKRPTPETPTSETPTSGTPTPEPTTNSGGRRSIKPNKTQLNQATSDEFEREDMGIAPKE